MTHLATALPPFVGYTHTVQVRHYYFDNSPHTDSDSGIIDKSGTVSIRRRRGGAYGFINRRLYVAMESSSSPGAWSMELAGVL